MRYCVLFILAFLLMSPFVRAQEKDKQEEQAIITINREAVIVHVTVTDPANRRIIGLKKENFEIYDNNVRQEIELFSDSEPNKVSLGILFDDSNSMHEKENKIRSAIEGLNKIKTYFGDANDEAFLCLFKGSLIMSDFTHNIPALNILFETDKPIGGTAFYDAVYAGIKKLKEEGKNTTKVLVIISDGQDNNSRRTFKEIRDLARETGVIIYAIGTFDMNDQFGREGRAILQDLVDMTGGRLFESTSIENACSQIASEAKCAYSIGFYPSDTPQVANTKKKESIVHKIKIKLVNLINLGLPSSIYKNLKHREREYYIGKD